MLNSSINPSEQQHRLQYLRQLLHKHPLAFCGGLWAVLVLLGSVAAVGLVYTGPLEQQTSKPTPDLRRLQDSQVQQDLSASVIQDSQPKQQDSRPKQDLPVSLFIAVAIGCAGGSLLFTQVLRQSNLHRQPPKRLRTTATSRKKRRYRSEISNAVAQTKQPVNSSALTVKALDNQLPQVPQVTVLPPEERNPLDRGNESLADMLDLRKHNSLTSLMRGK